MKKQTKILAMMALLSMPVMGAYAHNGGNGGDELEMDLKKRTLQIGHFIKSTMGSKVFNMLNADAVIDTVNSMDVDVTTSDVVDKYGTLRTCVNEPDRSLITCNDKKVSELLQDKEDVLTAVLFHEILGLMNLELGHQDNVSMYPISSKILPYQSVVKSTPITEAQIRPEFYGLDKRSYGITLVNKKTKESLRMICLNDNVEIHRCRNYSIVQKSSEFQTPLNPQVISLSPEEVRNLPLQKVTPEAVLEAQDKLEALKARGFKYISIDPRGKCERYAFGFGLSQKIMGVDTYSDCSTENWGVLLAPFLMPVPVLEFGAEVVKQTANIAVYPFKAFINGVRALSAKSKLNKYNKKLLLAKQVVNFDSKLSLIDKSKSVSNEDYEFVAEILKTSLNYRK